MTGAARALAIACLALVAAPARATADWLITPTFWFTFPTAPNLGALPLDPGPVKWGFGGSVAVLGGGPIGLEGAVAYIPGFFARGNDELITSSRVFIVAGNVMLATPRAWTEYSLRPFVSGGIALMRVALTDDLMVFPVDARLAGLDVGGGVIGFLSDRRGLRFELRYFRTVSQEETITLGSTRVGFWQAGVGVVLKY